MHEAYPDSGRDGLLILHAQKEVISARKRHTKRPYSSNALPEHHTKTRRANSLSQWLTFAPVSASSAVYFNTSETAINWLSTCFQFSFAVSAPFVIYVLHRGPKDSILAASALLLVGNWVRYAGTRAKIFGLVMFGQILTGLAQPFVLAAPTRYSDMWFTEGGRVTATALASLANPFGGAVSLPTSTKISFRECSCLI